MNGKRLSSAFACACLLFLAVAVNGLEFVGAQSPIRLAMLPFPEGEKLIYEIKISRLGLSFALGVITFEYLGPSVDQTIKGTSLALDPDSAGDLLTLRAEAVSKGFLAVIAGVNVNDKFETLVSKDDFSARLSYREEHEGDKNLAKTSLFSVEDQSVRFSVVDLNKPEAPARNKELARKDAMQSLLSAIYAVRTYSLTDGQLICIPVSESEQNYIFEIIVQGREAIQIDQTKLATIRLQPRLFGPGRFFAREGEMQMWVTDDERRTPVRLIAKIASGTISATIMNYDAQPPLRRMSKPAGSGSLHR